ncbi:hypothetical protein Emed_004850 [Eimeria media]
MAAASAAAALAASGPPPSLAAAAPSPPPPAAPRPAPPAATAKTRRPAAALAAVAAAAGLGRCHLTPVLKHEGLRPPFHQKTCERAAPTRALNGAEEATHLAQQRMQQQPWPRQAKRQRQQQQQQQHEQGRGGQHVQGHPPKPRDLNSPRGTAEAPRASLSREGSSNLPRGAPLGDNLGGEAQAGVAAQGVLPSGGSDDCDWPRCLNLLEEVWGRPGPPFELYRHLNVEPGATAAQIRKAFVRLAATAHPDKGGSPSSSSNRPQQQQQQQLRLPHQQHYRAQCRSYLNEEDGKGRLCWCSYAGPLSPGRPRATRPWISAEPQGSTPDADESLRSDSGSSSSSSSRSRSSSSESDETLHEEGLKSSQTSPADGLLSLLDRFDSKTELLRLTLPSPNCSPQQLHCLWQLCCALRASPVKTSFKLNPIYSSSVGHQTLLNARLWHEHRANGHASHKLEHQQQQQQQQQQQRQQQHQQQQQQSLEGEQQGCSGWLASLRSHLARPAQEVSDGFLHLHFLWGSSAACNRQPRERHEAGSGDRVGSCFSSHQTRPSTPALRGFLLSRDAAAATAPEGTLAALGDAYTATSNNCFEQESSGGSKPPYEEKDSGIQKGANELLLLLFAPKKLMPWKDLELLHAASAESCWCCCSSSACSSSSSSSSCCSSNHTLHASYPLMLRLQQQPWVKPQDIEVSHRPTAQQTSWLLLVLQALLEKQQQQQQQQDGQQQEQSIVLDVATPYCIRDSTQ